MAKMAVFLVVALTILEFLVLRLGLRGSLSCSRPRIGDWYATKRSFRCWPYYLSQRESVDRIFVRNHCSFAFSNKVANGRMVPSKLAEEDQLHVIPQEENGETVFWEYLIAKKPELKKKGGIRKTGI